MMPIRLIAACGAALSLCACGLPTYVPSPQDKLVTVQFYGFGTPELCRDGQRYALDLQQSNGLKQGALPSGERITVGSFFFAPGYQRSMSCRSAVSFVPLEGQAYYVNSGFAREKCFTEVVRQAPASETGMELELSARAPTC